MWDTSCSPDHPERSTPRFQHAAAYGEPAARLHRCARERCPHAPRRRERRAARTSASGFSPAKNEKIGRYDQLTSGCISARRRISPAGKIGERAQQDAPYAAQSIHVIRMHGGTPHRIRTARPSSRACANARRGRAMRDRASESIQISLTCTPPLTASINERSNTALWAITGAPWTNSARAATASTRLRSIAPHLRS